MGKAAYALGFERLQNYRVEGVGRWIPRERFVIWAVYDDHSRKAFCVDFHVSDDGEAHGPTVTLDHVDPWDLRCGLLSAVERVSRELRWSSTPSDLQGILARLRARKYRWNASGLEAVPADQIGPV